MKLVQKPLTLCIATICTVLAFRFPASAGDSSLVATIASYDPAKGFKPAQTNLTAIFLQVASSMESTGSPASYIRHMQAEHRRIAEKYKAKTGRELHSHWPAHMTDEYLNNFMENWNLLSPKLHLDDLAKDAGLCTREAIRGKRDTGTILVRIFDHHQKLVVGAMKSGGDNIGFEELKEVLLLDLELGKQQSEQDLVALAHREGSLNSDEQRGYLGLLRHERFTKADFDQLDRFYRNVYDKLSEEGKDEMSRRVWRGMQKGGPEDTRSEAIASVVSFQGRLTRLFKAIDYSVAPEKASKLKSMVKGTFFDLGSLAQAELELGILDFALR